MQKDVFEMLHESDTALLPVLAAKWNVRIDHLNTQDSINALGLAMLDPERAERIFDTLDEKARGAVQALVGAGRRMNAAIFERLYGEIRKMGAGRIERERPHENPVSVAEALYYNGLIAMGMDKVGVGIGPVVYIPADLAGVLPTHKTGYNAAALQVDVVQERVEKQEVVINPLDEVENIQQADTSIIDDLTTFLAYLQINNVELESQDLLNATALDGLRQFMLVPDDTRLNFLLGLGLSADLVEIEAGRAYPKRAEARRWLEGKRSSQLKALADGWRRSAVYRDLWHTQGLHPEPTGWTYDPAAAREAVLKFMNQYLPASAWWSLDEYVFGMKDENADFQRPGGDYDSWYIRNDEGEYLNGFESWDAVEGALLEFYILGPMHWLGLVDLAEDAARLTAYGRAFIDPAQQWPAPAETDERLTVQSDGTLLASRRVSRLERFQLARFTSWGAPATLKGGAYAYRIDTPGIQRADVQGINTGQIASFIQRATENAPLPQTITKLLENWRGGSSVTVTLERLLVMRTTDPQVLDGIYEAPALRRFLGARLGPMAVIVRPDQWEALREALGERGIQVEWVE